MKNILLPLTILFYISGVSFAQEYKQMIVTDIKHHVVSNTYYDVSKLSFPCYFSDSLFLADIRDIIIDFGKTKYAVDTIIFPEESLVSCEEVPYLPKLYQKVPDNAETKNLYMSISTSISYRMIEYQEVFYQLVTRVNIVDSKNKKRMKKTNYLPFMVKLGEGIVADTLIHRVDFEIFYLEALSAAFKGSPELFEKRFVYQPLTERYDDFLFDAGDYTIEKNDTSCALGKEDGERIPIIEIRAVLPVSNDSVALADDYKAVCQYQITHQLNKDQNNLIFFADGSSQIGIKVNGGMNSGDFSYSNQGVLNGTWNKDTVSIQWKATSSLSEVWINNQLAAIIHYRTDGEHLYFRYNLSPTSLAKIAFLVYLYDEAESVKLLNSFVYDLMLIEE